MPTFKPVIIKSDERRDGTYLVKIRMIHNRQIRYIKTPFYVHKSEITKKGVIKDRFLLDKLDERCAELRKKVSDLGFQIEGMSIDALKERLTSKEVFDLNITDFCERVCDDLRRNKREGTAQGYMCAINALKKYLNKDVVLASDVKKQVANAFVRQQLEINKIRSVKTRVALLSSLFNMAIKEYNDNDLGIIRVPYNPFNFVDNLDIKEEKKNAFKNIEQMQKLINHKTMQEYEKDIFIFSFCTFGMNMADIMKLKKTDYNEKENTIRYKRKKTERRCGENSLIEVKLNDVTTRILEKYKNKTKSELLFNLPKTARVLSYRKIAEELDFEYFTFYTARHTMATFARNICGIDKYVVHEMLNHASDTKMRVTDAYIDRSYTHLWEANEKLMGLFDWSIYLADF